MNNKGVYIIAEAGVNHNGSVETAMQLVDAALEAGVDAVKFQTFRAEALVTKTTQKAAYQAVATARNETQYEMLKKLELSPREHEMLLSHCAARGIQFLSTAFDLDSLDYIKSLHLPVLKVPSGELTNLPYLRSVNEVRGKVFLSAGMATLSEIADALNVLKDCDTTVLHCTTEYPCPFDSVNLKAMMAIRQAFNCPVGYSDHTKGIEIPIAAVALGASVIEKHFTLDRSLPGPDHAASIEPTELRKMVEAIRNVEQAMGDGVKRPASAELKNIAVARKSIVAKVGIKKGELLTASNLTVKRPGTGISPMRWDDVIGTLAQKDYEADELI